MKGLHGLLVAGASLVAIGASQGGTAQTLPSTPNQSEVPAAEPAASAPVAGAAVPSPATDPAPTDAGDVVVTAQRRSESLNKVPLSVTVVTTEALKNNGVTNLQSITKLAPSVQYSSDGEFSVRGIGTSTFAPTVESSVSQFVDDVAIGNRAFSGDAFYDVARVEVLNGPQGLLFGKNASAGLINITTTRPKLNEASGEFDAEGDSRTRPGKNGWGADLRSEFNLPIGDSTAVRVAGIYSHQDPVTRSIYDADVRQSIANSKYGGRIKLFTQLNDRLSAYLIGSYFQAHGAGGYYDTTFRSLGATSQYPAVLASAGIVPSATNRLTAIDGPEYTDLRTISAQGTLTYRFDNGVEISDIAAWKNAHSAYQFDSDYSLANFLNLNTFADRFQQFSNELRITLPGDSRLTGQGGLYYFWSRDHNVVARGGLNGLPAVVAAGFPFCVGATPAVGPPPACNRSNTQFLGSDSDLTQRLNSYAAFGQLSYAITDGLKLTAGGRVTHDRVDLDLLENTGNYFVYLGVPNNRTLQSVKATNFSWKVGPDWQVTPTTLLYGFYGRGYKGPGFSNAAPAAGADLSVRPEISNGGEIGLKTSLFDHKLSLTVAAFHTRFKNLQVQALNLALQTITLANAATATTKGVEVSAQLRPFRGLALSETASILSAKFNSYSGAPCYVTQGDASCAATGTFNAAGRPVALSAKFNSTTTAEYSHPLGDELTGVVTVNYQHRSRLNTGFAPSEYVPQLNRIDASIGLRRPKWDVALFCRNCTNQVLPYTVTVDIGDSVNRNALTYIQNFNVDSVRTLGLRFSLKY